MTPASAFRGRFGAFSEEAVRRFFRYAEPVRFRDFREVGDAVAAGAVDFGLHSMRVDGHWRPVVLEAWVLWSDRASCCGSTVRALVLRP